MKLVIVGSENKLQELISRKPEAGWIKSDSFEVAKSVSDADAFFFLDEEQFEIYL